jgi:hypothetical protein
MITIRFLADYPDTVPTLASWFRDQWPDYYANWSQAEMEQDFLEDASRNRLPSALLPSSPMSLLARLSSVSKEPRLYQSSNLN